MNLFDIIANSFAPTNQTVKGSIVTIAKKGTKVYQTTLNNAKVLATYDSGKILGTLQELRKMFVIKNGIATTQVFFMVKVKFSEPIEENNLFSANQTFNEGWVLAESLDVYGGGLVPKTASSSAGSAIYSRGAGVNVRTTAEVVGQSKDKTNNVIAAFNTGDLIGYSDFFVNNGFYKVSFVTPLTKKSDGKIYEFGYVSIAYANGTEPSVIVSSKTSKTPTTPSNQQKDSQKAVENDTKYSGISQNTDEQTKLQKHRFLLIGGAVLGLLAVIVYAVNKLNKSNGTSPKH